MVDNFFYHFPKLVTKGESGRESTGRFRVSPSWWGGYRGTAADTWRWSMTGSLYPHRTGWRSVYTAHFDMDTLQPTVSVHATHVLSWMLNLRCGGKGHAVNMVVSFRLCSVVLYRLSVCIRGCQKKKNLWCPLMRNYSRDVWCLQNDKGRLLCDHLGCRIHQLYIRNHKDQKKEKGAWSVFSHDFLWAKKTSCVEMKRKIFLCWDKKIRQKLKISDGRE